MKTKMTRQQWLVLIGACLFQCAFIGVLVNSSGVLLAQIRMEFDFPLTRISSYHTVKGIVGALGGVLFTSLFFKLKKPFYMAANILLVMISYLMLIFGARSNVLWYLSAAMSGASFCTSTIMVPFLLNQWFSGKAGTATGIAMAFSGLGGIVFNPFTAWLIACFGWRMTIVVLSLVMLLLAVIALVLLFHDTAPEQRKEDAQVSPRGDAAQASSAPFPYRKFLLCATALLAACFVMQFCQYVTIFSQDVGYSLQVGAALTSVFMAGNVGGKLLYGYACDKIGVYRAMAFNMAAIAVGSALFVFCNRYLPVLYIASILYGMVYGLSMISISRCCIETYGADDAKKYMGLHTSINGFLQAIGSMGVGLLYDCTGGFEAQLLGGIVFLLISICAALLLDGICRREHQMGEAAAAR